MLLRRNPTKGVKKNSPEFKLRKIQDKIKSWETKLKRSENALKKLKRKEKIWLKKVEEGVKPKEKKKYQTLKQKAMKMIQDMNCEVEIQRANSFCEAQIEVIPPEGYALDDCHCGFICTDWKDVIERMSKAELNRIDKNYEKENDELCEELTERIGVTVRMATKKDMKRFEE